MISIELLTAARKGDQKAAQRAAAALLPEARRLTLRLAARRGVPIDEAEAAVPEVCWLAIRHWDPTRGEFGAALFWEARSAVRDLLRQQRARELELEEREVIGENMTPEERADLGRLLGDLTPLAQAALLDVAEGLSVEESAARLGRSVFALRAARMRARRMLREQPARDVLAALTSGGEAAFQRAMAVFQPMATAELRRRAERASMDAAQAVELAPAVCRRALETWPRSGSFRHWLVSEVLVALRALAQPGARERRWRSDARVLEAVAKGDREAPELAVRKFSSTAAAELRRLKVEDAAERAPEVCRRALAAFDHRGSFRLWLKAEARRSLQPGYMDRTERTA